AAILLVERRLGPVACPVAACLAGLVAVGVWQIVPLPPGVLKAIAPARADLRADLLPTPREHLTGEPATAPPPGVPLSFDPGATRAEVANLLAVLALFCVVRFGFASPASFRRLAVMCVANAAALSVFALAQKFSSPPNVIYWTFESQGVVFGPFVCKNHFPYYTNACFGLGVGLLLPSLARVAGARAGFLPELGRRPVVLWMLAALALLLSANLFSLSRGGLLALAGGAGAAGIVARFFAPRDHRAGSGVWVAAALVGALGVGLVGWFGSDAVAQRLGTMGGLDALEEGRRGLWERTLPLALRYPAWGTGFGTMPTAEPQQRAPGAELQFVWDHAHNDYLQAFAEGGLPALALVLIGAGLVVRAGVRAYRRFGVSRTGGGDAALALGGLLGFAAVALHSLVDFGLHIPAVVA
ncbi:MAG: O-antigen ligase family protein, partial [Gemmataceae bacterium]|nr:O-antigen ligase family protein [Gemmataceae bacterium]